MSRWNDKIFIFSTSQLGNYCNEVNDVLQKTIIPNMLLFKSLLYDDNIQLREKCQTNVVMLTVNIYLPLSVIVITQSILSNGYVSIAIAIYKLRRAEHIFITSGKHHTVFQMEFKLETKLFQPT